MNQHYTQEIKVALVTGGARRLGAAIVKQLHQAHFRVAIHCHRSLEEANKLANDLNQRRANSAHVFQQELGTAQAAEQLITAVIHWMGRLDLLVNNAAIFIRTDEISYHEAAWDRLFTMNVKTPYFLSIAARYHLACCQGSIINLTDIHADKPLKNYAAYCQSKAALVMQTKTLAQAFAPEIRVNAIAPGAIAWPEGENQLSVEIKQQIIQKTPLKCHGNPAFVAQALLALVENSFITGQVLNVDGGRSII